MLANTGCPALRDPGDHTADDGQRHCALTDALHLGFQCSPAQTDIVTQWFGTNLDKLLGGGVSAKYVLQDHDWTYFCQSAMDEAKYVQQWDSLILHVQGERVIVDGNLSWRDGTLRSGTSKINDIFRIHDSWIEVVSISGHAGNR